MAIYWNLDRHLKRAGWTNANRLAEGAGIGYPAADRIMKHVSSGDPLGRFDMRTLDKLAKALGVKPLALLRYIPD
jgi:DNA-binding Xre family transcriptional regulator